MICACGIRTSLRLTFKSFFTETLGAKILLLKNWKLETPYGNSSCFLWFLVFGTRSSSRTKISFKLESGGRTNAGLPSSGSAFHDAAGGQDSSQTGRTWPYIREHHILCNASRANNLGQSDPEQGEKQSEICFVFGMSMKWIWEDGRM